MNENYLIFNYLGILTESNLNQVSQGNHNVDYFYIGFQDYDYTNSYLTVAITLPNGQELPELATSQKDFEFINYKYKGYMFKFLEPMTSIAGNLTMTFILKNMEDDTELFSSQINITIHETDNYVDPTITNLQYNEMQEVIREEFAEINRKIASLEVGSITKTSELTNDGDGTSPFATQTFVNSSIVTNTATFRGTYDTEALLPETGVDINDYAFVITIDENGNTKYNRYKFTDKWEYEYTLNNSSFTKEQWDAIQSGINDSLVEQIEQNKDDIKTIFDAIESGGAGEIPEINGTLQNPTNMLELGNGFYILKKNSFVSIDGQEKRILSNISGMDIPIYYYKHFEEYCLLHGAIKIKEGTISSLDSNGGYLGSILIGLTSKALYNVPISRVKINGTDNGSFYAPTTKGGNGQILKSDGTSPVWVDNTFISYENQTLTQSQKDKVIQNLGIMTNSVNNLVNYYTKEQSYSKDEVNNLINNISNFSALIVNSLPTENISTTTIYLISKTDSENNDYYDEYIYINNAWEMIGNTKVDLSNHYTKTETDNLLKDKVGQSEFSNLEGFVYSVDGSIGNIYSELTNFRESYLPLTAGSGKRITGNLYLSKSTIMNNNIGYQGYDSGGNVKDLIRLASSDTIILGDTNHSGDIAPYNNIRPVAGKSLKLGTSDNKWSEIHGIAIYQNGKKVANKEDVPTIITLTQAEYDDLGTYDENTLYLIKEE